MKKSFFNFKKMRFPEAVFPSESGATLIEIALYVALVVIVCIAVVASLGDRLQGVFNTIVDSL